jgi:lysophosphatidate acyltransferase
MLCITRFRVALSGKCHMVDPVYDKVSGNSLQRQLGVYDHKIMMGSITSVLRPLTYIYLPLLAIRFAASRSPIVKYYWRIGLYITTLALVSIWGATLSVVLVFVGKRFDIDFWTARSFYFVASNLLGIKFEIEGEEYLNTKPAILVGNHQSMLDILYLGP